ncbi:MAG: FAD-dependent oxidoreductase, partial [Flavobacteriales bacterium]|nr:FAD-dependent oxidoreductase [Flavobacteriales bacterium]
MTYDLVVLGSGPGGYVAAIRASQLGLKTAIIERESLGGICLNWGCIPTKALLKSAQVFDYLNHASDYGIAVSGIKSNFPEIVKRSRGVADKMSKGVQFLMKKNKIDVIMGTGMLKSATEIEVTDDKGAKQVVTGKNIMIATGARSRSLPSMPQDGKKIIGYREAMSLPQQPAKMVIVGSGAIGAEFAYFYQTMGTEVTLIEYLPNIVPLEDEEVSKQLERSFKKTGMTVMTSAEVTKVDTSGKGCKVSVKTAKGEQIIECDIVISAAGIVANIENIGLEKLGIKTERGKIVVNEFYQTNVTGVWAIGDCVPGHALAHVASAEG